MIAMLLLHCLLGQPLPELELSPADHYRLGHLAWTKSARLAQFRAGMRDCEARLTRAADDREALLWLAANLGAEALLRGKLAGLRALPRMESLMLRLDALDPAYDEAAAARTLGYLYSVAPPVISIGSREKAEFYFRKALSLAPEHPGNQALAAKFLHKTGRRAEARDLARKALANPRLDDFFPESRDWRRIAQALK